MALERNTQIPPSSNPTVSTQSNINASSPSLIDEKWILLLQEKIAAAYPIAPKYSWESPIYPPEDIASPSVSNSNKNSKAYQRYNPFNLRLPLELEAYEYLYERTSLCDKDYGISNKITYTEAKITYLNFLIQLNLAYITFLQAINGSSQALVKLKELFSTEKMFLDSRINTNILKREIKKDNFPLALLAYLALDIVFSKNNAISTAARVKAFKIIKENFELEKVAEAFNEFHFGYYPHPEKEPVCDMIPRRFVKNPEESGGTAHNKGLFFKNVLIKEIFKITPSRLGHTMNIDYGIATLLDKYPTEMLQVLQSFLRYKSLNSPVTIDNKFIFITLVKLSELNNLQIEKVFGMAASFRNDKENQRDNESRINWAIGHEHFGFSEDVELNKRSSPDNKIVSVTQRGLFSEDPKNQPSPKNELEISFQCPLSLELMKNPTFCTLDSNTYEKEFIEKWLIMHRKSPLDPSKIMKQDQSPDDVLFFNRSLSDSIQAYQAWLLKKNTHKIK